MIFQKQWPWDMKNGCIDMNIIKHNDIAFKVIASKPTYYFAKQIGEQPNAEFVDAFKQMLNSDTVIQSETHFIFCETIPDIDFEPVE